MEKYRRASQATAVKTAHAHCVLYTWDSGCAMPLAFPPQQKLHKRATMLRYIHTASHVKSQRVKFRKIRVSVFFILRRQETNTCRQQLHALYMDIL